MNNSQDIADKIKKQAKAKNLTMKEVLDGCSLNKNFVNNLANGKDVGYQSIVTLAEYLGCSVDYILGTEQKNATPDEIRRGYLAKISLLSESQLDRLIGFLQALLAE